jgi:hypothetical protein
MRQEVVEGLEMFGELESRVDLRMLSALSFSIVDT